MKTVRGKMMMMVMVMVVMVMMVMMMMMMAFKCQTCGYVVNMKSNE